MERAGLAVHITIEVFPLLAYTFLVMLLSLAEKVDIVVIRMEFFFGTGNALTGGTQIDVFLKQKMQEFRDRVQMMFADGTIKCGVVEIDRRSNIPGEEEASPAALPDVGS